MTTSPTATPGARVLARRKRQLNIYVNEESRAILVALLERDGVPYSAQVDRALKLWAKEKGIEVTHATPTTPTTEEGSR